MTDITHPALVKALVKNPIDILGSLTLTTIDLWHGATGVAGECGELMEGILLFDSMNATPAEVRENLMEESGDIYFYTEQLVQRANIHIPWDLIDAHARGQIISPDRAVPYACNVVVFGSQVLDTVKKAAIYNKALDVELLVGQLVGMLRNVATLGYMFGISREQALEHNINKLSTRYPGVNYTDAAAQIRADKEIVRKPFPGEPQDDVVIRPNKVDAAMADAINDGEDPARMGK